MSVTAFITEAALVRKILEHLGLPSGLPVLALARLPQELSLDFEPDSRRSTPPVGAEPHAADPPRMTVLLCGTCGGGRRARGIRGPSPIGPAHPGRVHRA